MIGSILSWLAGILILGLVWFLVSYLAYHLSVIIKRSWPINSITVVSIVFQWLYQMFLIIWFLVTAFSIFRSGAIVFGLIFVFILGGIIISLLGSVAGLITAIPLVFSEKIESRLNEMPEDFIDIDAVDVTVPKITPTAEKSLYETAIELVAQRKTVSKRLLMDELNVSDEIAINLLDKMEADGWIGPKNGDSARDVYIR